mmetsp:Transcript_1802/g.4476  ORF Transcript_1802/g.4476 Transcript_1802/m.4476 type:complete len:1019 (+) Transcript_1802:196-3252(+)
MGVPAFYRWLSQKYPKIIMDVIEEHPEEINGVTIPVDASRPNPQGVEFDNLYLDMNGIIHPCFHPEDRPAPTTEAEVFDNIFDYIDRLFAMIRPRKLLYMAIDGVAPRAKMNQQRSRRFRAAQEAEEKEKEEEELRQHYLKQGIKIPKKEKSQVADSNTITPGTPFMHRLAVALQYYVHLRLNSDPGWRNVKVILSDSNSPGEGEHKVMEYIRQQRNRPGTDPNTKHVVYGLDADLIMLALATHEPHFYILREVILQQAPEKPSFSINKDGDVEESKPDVVRKPFQLLKVAVLREYLALEFKVENLPFKRDMERELDDLVFMCFFVGNDFLPHSPSLEIREGAIELLMTTYKRMLPDLGGYLTFGGEVNLERVEKFIAEVSKAEEAIFARRQRMLNGQKKRRQRDKDMAKMAKARAPPSAAGLQEVGYPAGGGGHKGPANAARPRAVMLEAVPGPVRPVDPSLESNKGAAEALRARLSGTKRPAGEDGVEQGDNKVAKAEDAGGEEEVSAEEQEARNLAAAAEFKAKMDEGMKEKSDMFDTMIEDEGKIRLTEAGWRERYYAEKLNASGDAQAGVVKDMVRCYVEGVCWVMRYYYDGVASWDWYYPYHYAPFASDIRNLGDIKVEFQLGTPFKPFNQLMGVLPAASKHALPEPYQWLFEDKESPLLDFYPKTFGLDLNGKRFAWQAVCLLPFIDEKRLIEVTEQMESKLTEEEAFRNSNRLEVMYVGPSHGLVPSILELEDSCASVPLEKRVESKMPMDTEQSDGMAGYIALGSGEACPAVIHAPFSLGEDITANGAMGVTFINPDAQPHQPRLQEGTMLPPAEVQEGDLAPPKPLWHEDLPNHMRRGYQDNPNNRPQALSDAAHRHLQHSLASGRGAYNQYTGGYSRPQGGSPMRGGYGGPPIRGGYGAPQVMRPMMGGPPPQMMGGRGGFGGPPGPYGGVGGGGFPPQYGGPPPMMGGPPPMMGAPPMGGPPPQGGPYGQQPPMGGNNPFAPLQRPAGGRGGGGAYRGHGRGRGFY